jgi:cell division protein FtsI (penicillin-binding protein 3)
METKLTGHVKAISNLGRDEKSAGKYYGNYVCSSEKSHEPSSTLVGMIALLDDNKIDTTKFDSNGGVDLFTEVKSSRFT